MAYLKDYFKLKAGLNCTCNQIIQVITGHVMEGIFFLKERKFDRAYIFMNLVGNRNYTNHSILGLNSPWP